MAIPLTWGRGSGILGEMNRTILIAQTKTADYIANYRDVDKFIECCKVCKQYRSSWSCPSFNSDPKAGYVNRAIPDIERFELTTVIGVKIHIDEQTRHQAKDLDERNELIKDILLTVRQQIDGKLLALEQQTPDSLLFYAGTCRLCMPEPCSRVENKPCRQPDKMRSTLEAYGFDMGRTTSEFLGVKMKWCKDLELPPYFTLVYGLLSNKSVLDVIESVSFSEEQEVRIIKK